IGNFSWGGAEGIEKYKLDKLFETAEKVYERRELKFTEQDRALLLYLEKHYRS
ncbi:MAG TPA: glucose-1-phosphate thymidylyltransferase, partial [Bacteroidia bacterium]|nr:glucose-1-phosphate thymidylyltransferase [Bacteroidia bacterium]